MSDPVKPLGQVLRDAFDKYWEENPPVHYFGTEEYLAWYRAQNEFVAQTVAKASLPEWISVKDRLPTSAGRVLVWISGAEEAFPIWFSLGIQKFSVEHYLITHWMPLPEPPK